MHDGILPSCFQVSSFSTVCSWSLATLTVLCSFDDLVQNKDVAFWPNRASPFFFPTGIHFLWIFPSVIKPQQLMFSGWVFTTCPKHSNSFLGVKLQFPAFHLFFGCVLCTHSTLWLMFCIHISKAHGSVDYHLGQLSMLCIHSKIPQHDRHTIFQLSLSWKELKAENSYTG